MRGFTLLELVVVCVIVSIFAGVIGTVFGTKIIAETESATVRTLELLSEAYVRHYDSTGLRAQSVADLSRYVNTDVGGEVKDAWRRQITIVKDVYYNGVQYEALLLSAGRNGVVDSTITGDAFTPAGDDIFRLIPYSSLIYSMRGNTITSLTRANAGLTLYFASGGNNQDCLTNGTTKCIALLVSEGYVDPIDAYDAWGRLFVLSNGNLVSKGPDGVLNTSDDVIVQREQIAYPVDLPQPPQPPSDGKKKQNTKSPRKNEPIFGVCLIPDSDRQG